MNTEIKKNQGGRPIGSKNASTILREAMESESTDLIVKHFPKIVQKACEMAEKGDTKAMKILFDRIIPIRKASDDPEGLKQRTGVTIIIKGTDEVPKNITINHEDIENE